MKPESRRRLPVRWRVLVSIVAVLVVLGVSGSPVVAQPPDSDDQSPVEVVVFWVDGCPHCASEHEFLEDLIARREGVTLIDYEVSGDAANRELFADVATRMGFEPRAVPVTIIGDEYWVGFSDAIGARIAAAIDTALAGRDIEPATRAVIDVPGLGELDLSDRPLFASTVLIGFVDGFNPWS